MNRIVKSRLARAALVTSTALVASLIASRGQAMGSGFSYPVTVEAVARWTAGLDARGLQLAPASAMANRPGR